MKRTIAYWIRKFGFKVDMWNVYVNKLGQDSLTVSCYDENGTHEFYF